MIKAVHLDDRLIHGQVAISWTRTLGVDVLLVINDEIVLDKQRRNALKLGVPAGVKFGFRSVKDGIDFLNGPESQKYKIMAFSISAAMAGAAGVLYAHNLTTLTALPKNFGYNMSITILVFVVLGGIGSIRGSMISAVILTMLPEMLRSLDEYRMLIYAVVLIAAMILTWSPKAIELRERYSPMKLLRRKEKEVQ